MSFRLIEKDCKILECIAECRVLTVRLIAAMSHKKRHVARRRLEEMRKQYQLERFLTQLDRADLLICDELGYLTFSRMGAELLFQVFADHYERGSSLITSNLAFGEWVQVFQGERMTAVLLDRLTHHCHIFEMNGESYRFKQSVGKSKKK